VENDAGGSFKSTQMTLRVIVMSFDRHFNY